MSIYRWAKLDDQSGPDRSIELKRLSRGKVKEPCLDSCESGDLSHRGSCELDRKIEPTPKRIVETAWHIRRGDYEPWDVGQLKFLHQSDHNAIQFPDVTWAPATFPKRVDLVEEENALRRVSKLEQLPQMGGGLSEVRTDDGIESDTYSGSCNSFARAWAVKVLPHPGGPWNKSLDRLLIPNDFSCACPANSRTSSSTTRRASGLRTTSPSRTQPIRWDRAPVSKTAIPFFGAGICCSTTLRAPFVVREPFNTWAAVPCPFRSSSAAIAAASCSAASKSLCANALNNLESWSIVGIVATFKCKASGHPFHT